MDILTRDLLRSWGLTEYIAGFNNGKIDAGTLRLLGNDEINQLIPIPGDRARFKANLENWKTELKSLESELEYTGFHNRTASKSVYFSQTSYGIFILSSLISRKTGRSALSGREWALYRIFMDLARKEIRTSPWYKYVTVEPTMFLYMMAFMITNVVEQTFYVFRACTVDHGYSEEICYNITSYRQINEEVQVTVSNFHQWNGVASHIVPLCLAFFLGSYSDKRGRKCILLAGLIGKLYFSLMATLNTMKNWPLEYVIYTATFPSALTGADLAIFAGCFAYIADVTTADNRTLRVGILDAVYLSTMPLGVFIGNLLYVKVVNRSFTTMFLINSTLMLLATLHCLFFLKWRTRPEQLSLREAGVTNPILDFFDMKNVKQTMLTLLKKRSNHRTLFLWFLLLSMALYTFQRDERPFMYLYVQNVFEWDTTAYSNFRTYVSTAYVLTMFIGIPLMTKVLKFKDTCIVMIGAASHMTGHFLYAQATAPQTFYVGGATAALGPCVAPLVRSMTSKILPTAERGVAYAFLSVMENAVAMFASIIYSQLYNATIGTKFLNAIFYLTIGTQAIVFLFALSMEITLKGRRLESLLPEEEREIPVEETK